MTSASKAATAALLLSLAAVPPLAMAQKAPSLKQRFEVELKNKTFNTKITLRNMLADSRRRNVWNYVATNVLPGGEIQFRVSGVFMIDQGWPIPKSTTCGPSPEHSWAGPTFDGTLCWLDPGQSVEITDIDLEGEYLSLGYWPSGRPISYSVPAPALTLILGKNWQKTADFEQVMEIIGNALVIDRIERGRAVAIEFAALQQREQLNLRSPAHSLEKQLESAQLLRGVLAELITNRTEFERLGKGSAMPDVAEYSARIASLDVEIPRIRDAIRAARIETIRQDLAGAESEVRAFRATLRTIPKNQDELKSAHDVLSRWDINLRARQELSQALSSVDASLSVVPSSAVTMEREEVSKHRADLLSLTPTIELLTLTAHYARMRREEARLKAAYVAAFGTPRQRTVGAEFRNHLQSMIANRQSAERLGEAPAAELRRLRTQMAGIR